MRDQHLIDTAIIDVSCDHAQLAPGQDPGIDDLVGQRLMRVVDEVFDQAAEPGTVCRIARLEIDLGEIPYETYRDDMPERLREALSSRLAGLRHRSGHSETPDGIVIDRPSAEAELLYYFLLNGHLPWYSQVSAAAELETLLERVVRKSPGRLVAFLRQASHRRIVVARLVNQFSTPSIVRVYRLLSPRHCDAIKRYAAALHSLLTSDSAETVPSGLRPDRLMIRLWQHLIMASMRDSSQQTNAETLFERAFEAAIADRSQPDDANRARWLFRAMESHPDLRRIAAALQRFGRDAPARQSSRPDPDALAGQLVSALFRGDAARIRACWPALVAAHPRLLEKTLRDYAQQSRFRSHLASHSSDAMLLDLLVLLEPADHGFVEAVVDQADMFYADQGGGAAARAQRRTALWEASLGYLLVERRSGFSRSAYLDSVVRQRAVAARQPFTAALSVLNGNIARFDHTEPRRAALFRSLSAIGDDLLRENARLEADEVRLAALYRDCHCLKAGLVGTSAGGSERRLLDAEVALRHEAPWLLARLYGELQNGGYRGADAIKHYSVEVLRQLVDSVLAVTAGPQAAQRNAPAFGNRKSAYLDGLDRLLKIESIAAGSVEQAPPGQTAISVNPSTRREPPPDGDVAVAHAHALVSDFLNGDTDPNADTIESLVSAIEQMLSRQPSELCRLLEYGLAEHAFVERLAGCIPEWLQVRLLVLMGVNAVPDRLRCIEMLATACLIEGKVARPENLQAHKWTFIYQDLVESGRLFNRARFVRKYAGALLELTGLADSRQLMPVLRDALQRRMRPSESRFTRDLISALSSDAVGSSTDGSASATTEALSAHSPDAEAAAEEAVDIANAGIVLAAPYLPRLFESLGLIQDAAFPDRQTAERGVHMLQFLVCGAVSSPEYRLVLNKLLCGIEPGRPICRGIELSAAERRLLESLLSGLIQNWKALGNTSIDGLREAFLQRAGRLVLKNDAWHLSLEARAYDMLLDQIPWAFSTIRFPWMDRVIYVEWR